MKAVLPLLALVTIVVSSCTADLALQPDQSWRMYNSLLQGQSIEWDEEIIDSLVMPLCLQDSPTVFKNEIMQPRREKWHITVTVPDSNVKQFKIQRDITVKPVWDSLAAASERISRTIDYGATYTSYDAQNSIIDQHTVSGSLDDADFSDLPFFEYRLDSAVTSGQFSEAVDSLVAKGSTITDLGTAGLKAVKTLSREGKSYFCTAIFDKTYFTMLSSKIEDASGLISESSYEYSDLSGLKIATKVTTSDRMHLGADMLALYAQEMPERDYTCLGDLQSRTTVILTNIQLP